MKVRISPLSDYYREMRVEIDDKLREVMEKGYFILGSEVTAFEREFAAYTGSKHCIGVGTGLDALILSLRASGIGVGDEVIVPSNTYVATWIAATAVGGTLVPVEPDSRTYNIDPQRVEERITRRTRAIIVVDLYGQPADVDPILEVARQHDLQVIDDAAQSHGALYRGRKVGGHVPTCAFSFYPTKNLGAFGDGGGVTTDDPELAQKIRELRNYGTRERYVSASIGTNSRLDEIQAAILRLKLKHLDAWNSRRRDVATEYLSSIENPKVTLPYVPDFAVPVWHQFVIRSPQRDRLQQYLNERGVETLVHYPVPPHLQPAYSSLSFREGSFPLAEALAKEVLSIPIGQFMTPEETSYVTDTVSGFA
jgi:dTDP-4-amino-4,6-dideoxygalactose transaminase